MFLETALLAAVGTSAGGIIAAGVFAFLAIIGVFPRLMGKTATKCHVILYETVLILGGTLGNMGDLWPVPLQTGPLAPVLLGICGMSLGIFVGCLVMSLAETLKALPTLSRRICLSAGLQYVVLSIALGKLTGALIYFVRGFGG